MRDSQKEEIKCEDGSVIQLKSLPFTITNRHQLIEHVRHFAQPYYVDYDKATKEGYLRFASRDEAEAFLAKVNDKELKS
jgi:hypothetical protein